jgi:hypothetical protein
MNIKENIVQHGTFEYAVIKIQEEIFGTEPGVLKLASYRGELAHLKTLNHMYDSKVKLVIKFVYSSNGIKEICVYPQDSPDFQVIYPSWSTLFKNWDVK